MENIATPVDAAQFKRLLVESNYDKASTNKIVDGFTNGFSLQYQGDKLVKRTAPNLPLHIGTKFDVWEKVMKEIQAKRFAGPYESIPFEYFVQSPIGLVPKDKGTKTRLIFHLSYPKTGDSVNTGIPKDLCSVQYPEFDLAIRRCIEEGIDCSIARSDFCFAFRNVPLDRSSWPFLVLKAEHPVTHKVFYMVDKCLPFGSSISCALFQEISGAIAHVVVYRTNKPIVNYLDDYLFIAAIKVWCDAQVRVFIEICTLIRFPVSMDKTFWGTNRLTFLGMLIDTLNQMVCVPADKVEKARELLEYFLSPATKKTTVHRLQKLCGFLNFLCRCVVPGRAFTRRLYSHYSPKLKPHHHIKVNAEIKSDLAVWYEFISKPDIYCRPFMDYTDYTAVDINMYSDASGNFQKGGFGAYCDNEWMCKSWKESGIAEYRLNIDYLELYAVAAAVLKWIHKFQNRRIYLFCDNKGARDMINASSAKNKNSMVLIRLMTLKGLQHNVRIFAKYVESGANYLADHLSRGRIQRFLELAPKTVHRTPVSVPRAIWPIDRIWVPE